MKPACRGPYGGYAVAALMLLFVHACFWTGCQIKAADPVSPIILPTPPAPPQPPPSASVTLVAGQSYPIQANAACVIVASPDDVVEICTRKGPITVDAVLWPATTAEVKDYTCQTLYLIRPKATGACELIIVSGTTVIRQALSVSVGPAPPPIPPPTDPLTKQLQDAFTSETDATKADKLSKLATYYGAIIATERAAGKATTVKGLQTDIHAGADVITGAGGMPALRKAIAAYVAAKMPAVDGPLDDKTWLAAQVAYSDVAAALKGVK